MRREGTRDQERRDPLGPGEKEDPVVPWRGDKVPEERLWGTPWEVAPC